MDEATEFLMTLEATAPDAPTACAGWTAHDVVAHLAAGASEMADLIEAATAGRPSRATRAFADREAPFAALPDAELRDRLVLEALRLGAATEVLGAQGPSAAVAFSGRSITSAEVAMHGRSEAGLHRWDLAGDDAVSRELLDAPELTEHAVGVLNEMLAGSPESISTRAATVPPGVRLTFGSPGRPDVVFVSDGAASRVELAEPSATPTATADPATRLLALWGRRSTLGPVQWSSDGASADQLAALLWAQASESPAGSAARARAHG